MAISIADSQEFRNKVVALTTELIANCFGNGALYSFEVQAQPDDVARYKFVIVKETLALELEGFLTMDLPAVPTTADDIADFYVSKNLGHATRLEVRPATTYEQAIARI